MKTGKLGKKDILLKRYENTFFYFKVRKNVLSC